MNKHLLIGLIVLLTTGVVIGTSEVLFKNKAIIYSVEYSEGNNSSVALFVEEDGAYVENLSNEFPVDMNFNSEKSYCVHGGSVSYDEGTSKLKVSSSGSDKCYVYFDEVINYFNQVLLDNYGGLDKIESNGVPDFTTTDGSGIYKGTDVYGDTYYFRGEIDNNWVYFGGFYWRIVRVNGDGTIRMIYSGVDAPSESTKYVMTGNNTQISNSAFSSEYLSAEYVGYMYNMSDHYGLENNSTIKDVVDTWYEENMLGYAEFISDNTSFCYSRSAYSDVSGEYSTVGVGSSNIYFSSYINLFNISTPSMICSNILDYYTVGTSDNGNKALTYPVGLLSAEEASFAGLTRFIQNSSNYLYTNKFYWLGSPYSYVSGTYMLGVGADGNYYDRLSYNSNGVRPVLSLRADVVISGSGIWSDPYKIS